MGITIKDAQLVEQVTGEEKIPVSDGSGLPKSVSTKQIKEYVGSGDSNVQSDWAEENQNSDAYIKNKPTIPDEVTEQTVQNWGFTKNQGDYTKPTGGIPKSDLSSGVQISLDKSETALQKHQDISHLATKTELEGKVDKIDGKQLSTEDFTTALKDKLQSLSNYDDTALEAAINQLRSDFDTLVDGDTTTAIKTFNEIVAFLEGISDSENLDSIIASIEQQIAEKQDKITDLETIRSGAAKGDTALQTSGGTMTGDVVWDENNGLNSKLPGHIYRNLYPGIDEVYDNYFPSYEMDRNTSGQLRVWNANIGSPISLFFSGDGRLEWKGGKVWHEGNDGADSGLDADTLDGKHGDKFMYSEKTSVDFNDFYDYDDFSRLYQLMSSWGQPNAPFDYGSLLHLGVGEMNSQLAMSHAGDAIKYRARWWSGNGGTWTDWKTIAFTDSNITGSSAQLSSVDGVYGENKVGLVYKSFQDASKVGAAGIDGDWSIPEGTGDSITGCAQILRLSYGIGCHYNDLYFGPNLGNGIWWRQVVGNTNQPWQKIVLVDKDGYYRDKLKVSNNSNQVVEFSSTGSTEASVGLVGSDGFSWAFGKGCYGTGNTFCVWSQSAYANVLVCHATKRVSIGKNTADEALDVEGNGKFSGSVTAASFNGTATQADNANRLEANYTKSVRLGNEGAINEGWVRIAKGINGYRSQFIVQLNKSFSNGRDEGYTFAVNFTIQGASITQLSGNKHYTSNYIPRVRVEVVSESTCYFDFYVDDYTSFNDYSYSVYGPANTLDATFNPEVTGTIVEFETSNGVKSNNGFTGDLNGTATSAIQDGEGNDIADTYATKTQVNAKQDAVLKFTNLTASSWVSDSTYADYPYRCDISCNGVTAEHFAEVVFGIEQALSGAYAPICETKTNVVSIWSSENTTTTIPTIIITK